MWCLSHNKSQRESAVRTDLVHDDGGLLFLFCPSNLTAPNKGHHPPLVIPTRIPAAQHWTGPRVRLSVKKGA